MGVLNAFLGVTDSVTSVVRMIVLLIFGGMALFFFWGAYAADSAIEEISEKAEKMHERQLRAEEQYAREITLAQDDWGSGAAVSSESPTFDDDDYGDGWGSSN